MPCALRLTRAGKSCAKCSFETCRKCDKRCSVVRSPVRQLWRRLGIHGSKIETGTRVHRWTVSCLRASKTPRGSRLNTHVLEGKVATCSMCGEAVQGHVCDPDVRASFQMITRNASPVRCTKPFHYERKGADHVVLQMFHILELDEHECRRREPACAAQSGPPSVDSTQPKSPISRRERHSV